MLVAHGLEKTFGDRAVLRGADLVVHAGERVGLVGVNGSGKSTLLRLLADQEDPDHGTIERQGSLGLLEQHPTLPGRTVGEAAEQALAWHRALLEAYQQALDEGDLRRSSALQDRLDREGWELDHTIDALLHRLRAPSRQAPLDQLSGGELRRVALARALLGRPDVLLLDEPTNHLDADTVEWLQTELLGWRGAMVLVTHDRYLLEAVATRIIEVEDGQCVSYQGSYADYLIQRVERRARMERADGRRLAFIAREAAWASRSPAARSTKQKGRLQRLDALKAHRKLPMEKGFDLDLRSGRRLGGTVLELHGVSKRFGQDPLIEDLNLTLSPGDRLGVLGPNGCGKSTLLDILRGVLEPDRGERVVGSRVLIATLDQARSGLDPDLTVLETTPSPPLLERFLFPRPTHSQRVRSLSGGERARLLMSRLLLDRANVLMLDEPTNDLDLPTLRVMEEALLGFDGAAVIVTHDRALLDRVCTGVLVCEQDGHWQLYADRLQHLKALREREERARDRGPRPKAPIKQKISANTKLSNREREELAELPRRIEALEQEQQTVGERLGDPDIYRARPAEVAALKTRLETIPVELEQLFQRWEALEARS